MALYALTIFASAFLLFLVQPLIARQILPWFGGSSAVWSVCLVFFQALLLAGYGYAAWMTRRLGARAQASVHLVVLAASLVSLPIVASTVWRPAGGEDPIWRILGLLTATIGLPYFLLATTSPLVQAWFARSFPRRRVYRLFALSNLAALVALVSYPFAIEPWLTSRWQAYGWSAGYALFALVAAGTTIISFRRARDPEAAAAAARDTREAEDAVAFTPARRGLDRVLWLVLPAMSTWLLLAVTNHITENIAAVPFLWLVPLALYLASFVITFDHERWYHRGVFLVPALAALAACAWGLQTDTVTFNIKIAVPLYTGGLFLCCIFCHGELARLKPAARDLTSYYLLIAAGGALGGLAIGIVAPKVLTSSHELGAGLTLTALVAAVTWRRLLFLLPVAAIGVAGACGYFSVKQMTQQRSGTRVLMRSFFGTLRTEDTMHAAIPGAKRRLINGVIMHGEQYLDPDRRREPTSYYGATSGIGLALTIMEAPNRHVGVIGLGTGSLAAYSRAGDVFRFYDINPQVVEIANREFTYLRDSPGTIEIAVGDARLSLERESSRQFDVLAIDAFSSDAIPVHLLTREAMAVYLRHMKPDGVIAVHVSNRFFNLPPVVKQIADAYGLPSVLVIDVPSDVDLSKSDWVLITRNHAVLDDARVVAESEEPDTIRSLRPWTDDYTNLFRILR
jgi:SAM-dependent methyltransferase